MITVGFVALLLAGAAGSTAVAAALLGRLLLARAALTMLGAAVLGATLVLVRAILRLDFSFVYVAEQSRARSSTGYRIAAPWGGAEGSLLFFTALLALVVVVTVWRTELGRWGLGSGAAIITALVATIAGFANPFARAELPPIRGAGLTPILEHPAMLYHPPILYLGLVTTVVAFLIVVDRGDTITSADLLRARRGVLMSWTLLIVGMATGANWAYVELGWGGYWAWDPVENTVLIPWLVLGAGLHLLAAPALVRRFPLAARAVLVAPFPLVLFGAVVTRSGRLSSVHAFADADALGVLLGGLVACVAALAVIRTGRRESPRSAEHPIGTSGPARFVGVSVMLSLFMTVVVLLGVGFPLLPGVNRIVTAPYYNRVGAPVLLAALFGLMLYAMWSRSGPSAITAMVLGLGLGLLIGVLLDFGGLLSWVVLPLAGAVTVGHLWTPRRRLAVVIGHIGFVVAAIGIAASANSASELVGLAPGEQVEFGSDLVFVYESFVVTDGPRPNSEAVTASVVIRRRGSATPIIELAPALVSYPDRAVVLAETSLHSTPRRDIQVVLRTISDEGLASFELSERSGQMLVWWGAMLIAAAGVVAAVAPKGHSG